MVDSFAATRGIIYRKYTAGLKAYWENISVSKFLSSATQRSQVIVHVFHTTPGKIGSYLL